MNFEWLARVPPSVGSFLYSIGFLGLIVWALRWRTDAVYEGAPDRRRWRDLRVWIVVLAVTQILLYLVF